jgi:hypothetical protein
MFGLTTIGKTIWLLRIWILLIDCMPILFKISLSLRSRRPYDALIAAQEEEAIANALKVVDDAYSQLGQEFWDRMAERDMHRRHLWRKVETRAKFWKDAANADKTPTEPVERVAGEKKRRSRPSKTQLTETFNSAELSESSVVDDFEYPADTFDPPPSSVSPLGLPPPPFNGQLVEEDLV